MSVRKIWRRPCRRTFPALVQAQFRRQQHGNYKECGGSQHGRIDRLYNMDAQHFGALSGDSAAIFNRPRSIPSALSAIQVSHGKCWLRLKLIIRNSILVLPPILGYESKWHPDSPYWNQISYKPAVIDDETYRKLIDYSTILFERTGCRDYARFDFRADEDGVIRLLEVNPNPGWCWDGKMNIMMGFEDLRYADMLRLIIEAAIETCPVSPGRVLEQMQQ